MFKLNEVIPMYKAYFGNDRPHTVEIEAKKFAQHPNGDPRFKVRYIGDDRWNYMNARWGRLGPGASATESTAYGLTREDAVEVLRARLEKRLAEIKHQIEQLS